ncbi:PAS domain S-box protein [Motilibacter deserti]|uniref:histidine kinase n=1 Tax=Motilibacter deserti TaxID=2714956 RepID=A0ABX0GWD5_9ACTN|nr:PAS domain S-box protein [Motilibacter deserti]NHC15112.1 PAS domain S-box protein [Motilibacter deserti]
MGADTAAALQGPADGGVRERALVESEARFRSLFDSSPIGMALVGLDGSWLRVNPAVAAITGYPVDELLALDFRAIMHPDDLGADLNQARLLRDGRIPSYQQQTRYVRKDGRVVHCLLSVTLLRDEDGVPLHFLCQIVDVDAERRSRELSDVMFERSPDPTMLLGDDGRLLRANSAWERVLGWPLGELQANDVRELIHPEDREATLAAARAAAEHPGGVGHPLANRMRTKAGDYRWMEWSGALLPSEGGLMLTGRDVTPLRTTQEQFRAAFEASPIGLVIADEQGVLLRVNDAFARLLGGRPEELIARTWQELTHPDDLAEGERQSASVVAAPHAVRTFEKRFVRLDGAAVPVEISVTLLTGASGERHRFAQVQDVTARREAAARAARETGRLRTAIAVQREVTAAAGDRSRVLQLVADRAAEALPTCTGAVVGLLSGTSFRVVAATASMAAHVGREMPASGSLSGVSIRTGAALSSADTSPGPRVDAAACRVAGAESLLVEPLFAGDSVIGGLMVVSDRREAFDDADAQQLTLLADALSGALRHATDAARNVRLLQQANDALSALEASETRFRLAFDSSPLGMVLTSLQTDDAGTFLQVNAAMARITGYPASTLVGMRVHDLHHPEDLAHSLAALDVLAAGRAEQLTGEKRYRHADGHDVWVRLNVAVVRDETDAPSYLVTQVEDITAQRVAAAQLAERAQLLDLTQDAVIVRDLEGRIRYWNPAAEQIYGWPASVAMGHDVDRLLATAWPDGACRDAATKALLRDGAWQGELEHRRADGHRVTVLSRKALQRDEQGCPVAVLSINSDVTARRAAERALAASEQRFRSQFVHTSVGQLIRTVDDVIEEVNPAFAQMVGWTPGELVGRRASELYDPSTQAIRQAALAGIVAGDADSSSGEGRLVRRDGSRVDVHVNVSAIRGADGAPERFVAIFQDISDRKAAEAGRDRAMAALSEQNAQLADANQLKLDLIGMLGHEIGNPLASILGYSELALDGGAELSDDARRVLETIERNAHRLDGIVREVLALVAVDAGKLSATPEPTAVRPHLEAALAESRGGATLSCPPDSVVLVQPGHLDQILANLLSNAVKYADGATALTVSTRAGRTEIRVEDDGPGVPAPFRSRLFERFARDASTAGRVKGTGLGLYIVRELARANGGDVHYEARDAGGSAFVVSLPAPG